MAELRNFDLTKEDSFTVLLQRVADLQSLACDIDMQRQMPSIFEEERNKSIVDNDEEDTLKLIKQTTSIARLSMNLLVHGMQAWALRESSKSKCFNSFSSAISYIREIKDLHQPPKHLLLEWEKNVMLIDLFINDEGLYCNRRIAQEMFDICMETFDWLRSIVNNNK